MIHAEEEHISGSFSDEELNAVRERAFTPELRSLVDEITRERSDNEFTSEQLLREMHTLFYTLLSHENKPVCNEQFDPLSQGEETNELLLLEALQKALATIEVKEFALLFYSVMEKAFVPHFNTFDGIHPDSFRLSLYENTYNLVFDSTAGIIIDRTVYDRTPFLHNRLNEADFDSGNLYCVFLSSILPRQFREFVFMSADGTRAHISPMIICRVSNEFDTDKVVSMLERDIALPVYMLYRSYAEREYFSGIQSLRYVSHVLDLNLRVHTQIRRSGVYLVRFKLRPMTSSFHMMKHVHSKLLDRISDASAIMHISLGIFVLMLDGDDIERTRSLFAEFNELYGKEVEITNITRLDMIHLLGLLQQ